MTATAADPRLISLPAAAMKLGLPALTPDRLRSLAIKHPEVMAFFTTAGRLKLTTEDRLGDLKQTIEPLLGLAIA